MIQKNHPPVPEIIQNNTPLKDQLQNLPEKFGVYLFKDKRGKILYVGKAINIKNRVGSYFTKRSHLGPRTNRLLNLAGRIDYYIVDSEVEALLLEARLIKNYQPIFNTVSKDDSSYLYIKITKETYPHVEPARLPKSVSEKKRLEKHAYYYGPFPSAKVVRTTLKLLRKTFPFCSAKKIPSKACFYYGIGLCLGPCVSAVDNKTYKKMIRRLRLLLTGRKTSLLHELKKEMQKESDNHNYEAAATIRDMIKKIVFLTSAYHMPEDYLLEPNLLKHTHQDELRELRTILSIHFPKLEYVKRIEAYDISNISGKNATGSMVVFVDGEADKAEYRRFKIRYTKDTPNDVQMMKEVISRRIKHTEWSLPDLFLIDGGKGQVGAINATTKELGVIVPIVGLAKREEILVIQTSSGEFNELRIQKKSPALKLIQRIRDESHRFAKKYHLLLRRKQFLTMSKK